MRCDGLLFPSSLSIAESDRSVRYPFAKPTIERKSAILHLYRYSYSISISQRAFCIGDVMQLRRPTRFVRGVGISNYFRRILWTARTLHKASEAISLFSNSFFSKDLIKMCCAALSCGAMIADTKALTLAGLEGYCRRIDGGRIVG
jgi:hypothetical protein